MINRRKLILTSFCTGLSLFSYNRILAQEAVKKTSSGKTLHNISSYRYQKWENHFKSITDGAILSDTKSKCLHFWIGKNNFYKIFPTSVPLTPELTRTGYTKVIKKVVGPDWRPTISMRKRDPQLPEYMPSGPDNPLGTHALYLSWPNYRIHGTSDTRKIGRQSSSGCIGLYNEHIEEIFNLVKIGTPVRLI
mgnify:FL=1